MLYYFIKFVFIQFTQNMDIEVKEYFRKKEKGQDSNYKEIFLVSIVVNLFIKLMQLSYIVILYLIEILVKFDRCFLFIVNFKYVLMSFKWLEFFFVDVIVVEIVNRFFRVMGFVFNKWCMVGKEQKLLLEV